MYKDYNEMLGSVGEVGVLLSGLCHVPKHRLGIIIAHRLIILYTIYVIAAEAHEFHVACIYLELNDET